MSSDLPSPDLTTAVSSKQAKRWREVDGVIYLTVTLDKRTAGKKWISRTEKKGNRAGGYAKCVLRSKKFKSSVAGTYEIVILKGSLIENDERILFMIRVMAYEMKLQTPNTDIGCLIREQFSDKEIEAMGLQRIVTMHEPIEDFRGYPNILAMSRDGDGRWLDTYRGCPVNSWNREYGFAYLAPQVS